MSRPSSLQYVPNDRRSAGVASSYSPGLSRAFKSWLSLYSPVDCVAIPSAQRKQPHQYRHNNNKKGTLDEYEHCLSRRSHHPSPTHNTKLAALACSSGSHVILAVIRVKSLSHRFIIYINYMYGKFTIDSFVSLVGRCRQSQRQRRAVQISV